jgi:hypothetical protein
MIALLAGAALAVAALVYVLVPLFDSGAGVRARPAPRRMDEAENAIDALREIEFDRATGKLSDDDYGALKTQYTRSALAEMRAREGGAAVSAPAAPAVDDPAPNDVEPAGAPAELDAAEAAVLRYRAVRRECETCGPRPEPDPAFCSSCGQYLKGACAHCGARVDTPASRFCQHCGRSLAA